MITKKKKGLAVAKEYAEKSWWSDYKIYQKEWKKYGKHRIYISFSGFVDGREQKNYNVGYVDVLADRFYKTI